MRTPTKPTREKYCEYILYYVDDLLCISHYPNKPINDIQSTLKFKNGKVYTPDFSLGAKLKKKDTGEKEVLTISSTDYIKSAVENVEKN